jgi:hypothetical protein
MIQYQLFPRSLPINDRLKQVVDCFIEVEAGRAVDNNQFLKDIFQACMMFAVDYLILGVKNYYRQQ